MTTSSSSLSSETRVLANPASSISSSRTKSRRALRTPLAWSSVLRSSTSGRKIKLQIWDTAGQERYRSVTRSYYRGAAGALIVYDITNRDSYSHLINWLADARTLARADISIVAAGNKCDLKDKRAVTFLESSRIAQENDILFLETSALPGEGVEEVFIKVARMILNKIEDGLIDPNTMVSGIHTGSKVLDGASKVNDSKPCSC